LDESKVQQLVSDIEGVRKKLDVYVVELHKDRSFGMSVYEAISRFGEHDVPGAKDLRVDYNGSFKPHESNLVDIEEAIRNANQAFSLVQDADIGTLQHVRTKNVVASITRDAEDMTADLRIKANEYIRCLGQLRDLELPVDITDGHQCESFISSMLSIDGRVSKERDLAAVERSLKAIIDGVVSITNDLRTYADMGFNISPMDIDRTHSLAKDV
jgi:hypothetical protein